MENDAGEVVDIYMPRKCSATNNVIGAKDHASVQINFAQLDGEGRFSGDTHTMALCGYVRGVGEGDDSINRLTQEAGMLHKVFQA